MPEGESHMSDGALLAALVCGQVSKIAMMRRILHALQQVSPHVGKLGLQDEQGATSKSAKGLLP